MVADTDLQRIVLHPQTIPLEPAQTPTSTVGVISHHKPNALLLGDTALFYGQLAQDAELACV